MAEDELMFDTSMKKKKKKKKTPFDLDAAEKEAESVEHPAPAADEADETAEVAEEEKTAADDFSLDDDFSNFTKKKKKKSKKVFDMSEMETALPAKEKDEEEEEEELDVGDDFDFNLPKKKKKNLKKRTLIADDEADNQKEADDVPGTDANQETSIWSQNSDKDYTYDELLKRVFDIMRDKNPDMVAGEKKRFIMKPPQVMRAGAKKSSFSNFAEICKALHRQPKHLLAFLLSELGTSGSIDGSNQLIIKGRFQQKQIEHVLRRYIKEYVTCHTCRSPDTILQKDTRLYFLQCESCGSRCSVTSIKSGFQAVTGKRAAIRAKTA
ncbi:hypothetical protein CAPTEDRAFT_152704 [Capitella teleta]|uniref:Eukaryotic translation initiation factor 2 subunit 2 n=1 Tax=Capitella teleta TaxID=283909 RepID=R7T6H4_CAPTE|nr:hypothetical protein CAPTEDRAFT_152704 [Capitella teleta]|eukprot:ELT89085.1 hypothetical protein CAPTEDRAFT_152704 [Capitella teleta]